MSSEKRAFSISPQHLDYAAEKRQQVDKKVAAPLAEIIKATGIDGKLGSSISETDIAIYLDKIFNCTEFYSELAKIVEPKPKDGKFFWEAIESWLTNVILQQNTIAQSRYDDIYAIVKTKLRHHFFAQYRIALNPTQTSLQFKTSEAAKLVSAYFNVCCFNNSEHSLKPNGTQPITVNKDQHASITALLWPEAGEFIAAKYLNLAIVNLKDQKIDQAVRCFTWYLECYSLDIAPLTLTNPDFIRQFLLTGSNQLISLQADYQKKLNTTLALNKKLTAGELKETNPTHQAELNQARIAYQESVTKFLDNTITLHSLYVSAKIQDAKFKSLLTSCHPQQNLSFSNLAEVSTFLETVFENDAVYVELANRLQNSSAPNATEWDAIKKSLVSTIQLTAENTPAEQVKDFISAKIDMLFLQQYKKSASQQRLTFASTDRSLVFCSYFNSLVAKSDDQMLSSNASQIVDLAKNSNALIEARNQILNGIQGDYLTTATRAIKSCYESRDTAEKEAETSLEIAKEAFITYLELTDKENAEFNRLRQNKAEVEAFLQSAQFKAFTEGEHNLLACLTTYQSEQQKRAQEEKQREQQELKKRQNLEQAKKLQEESSKFKQEILTLKQKLFAYGAQKGIKPKQGILEFEDIAALADFLTETLNNKELCQEINRLYASYDNGKFRVTSELLGLFKSSCNVSISFSSVTPDFIPTFISNKLYAIAFNTVENSESEEQQRNVCEKFLEKSEHETRLELAEPYLTNLINIFSELADKRWEKSTLSSKAAFNLLAYVALTENNDCKNWPISNYNQALDFISKNNETLIQIASSNASEEQQHEKLKSLIASAPEQQKLEREQKEREEQRHKLLLERQLEQGQKLVAQQQERWEREQQDREQREHERLTQEQQKREQQEHKQKQGEEQKHKLLVKKSPEQKSAEQLRLERQEQEQRKREQREQQKSDLLNRLENYRYPLIAKIFAGIAWCITYPAVWFGARPAFDRFLDKQNLAAALIGILNTAQDTDIEQLLIELKALSASAEKTLPNSSIADGDFRPNSIDKELNSEDTSSQLPPCQYRFFAAETDRNLAKKGEFFNQVVQPTPSKNDANTNHP